jgi:mono/diheme cytochrome c family protein
VNRFKRKPKILLIVGTVFTILCSISFVLNESGAQQLPNAIAQRPNPYARKPVDATLAEQGKSLFSVRCAFCHGSDARGGESGPNLLRSEVVLNDQDGEMIGEVILHGRPQQGMPPFEMSSEQIKQIAGFLHSLPVSGNERGRNGPIVIPVGDAAAGKKEFDQKCASCHSAAGDLKGIGAKIKDPRALQQSWMMPGMRGGDPSIKAPEKKIAVMTSGGTVSGELLRIDDFIVRLKTESGEIRSFTRKGGQPKVVVTDPLKGHLELLSTYTDKSIHDITAYMVSIQ